MGWRHHPWHRKVCNINNSAVELQMEDAGHKHYAEEYKMSLILDKEDLCAHALKELEE